MPELKRINEFLTRKIKFRDEQTIKSSKEPISSKQYAFEFNNKIKKKRVIKKSKFMITPRENRTMFVNGNANSKSSAVLRLSITKECFSLKSGHFQIIGLERVFDSLRFESELSFSIFSKASTINQLNFDDYPDIHYDTQAKKQITFTQTCSPFFDTFNSNDQPAGQVNTKTSHTSVKLGLQSFKTFNTGAQSIRLRKATNEGDPCESAGMGSQPNDTKSAFLHYFKSNKLQSDCHTISSNLSKLYSSVKIGKIKCKLNNNSIDISDYIPLKPSKRLTTKRSNRENADTESGGNQRLMSPMFPPNSIPIKLMKNLMKYS